MKKIYCHSHPNVEMVKLKRKLVACPQCGRVRAKKYSASRPPQGNGTSR